MPVFVPDLGCKGRCVFCDQKSITGQADFELNGARSFIERALLTVKEGARPEIGFFGGSFSGLPAAVQEGLLEKAQEAVKDGRAAGIRLSTRPDLITDEVLARFGRFGVTAVELGAQSFSDEVLTLSKRGHTAADTEKAAERIRAAGFSLGLQMMVGLPGDTYERALHTAEEIIRLKSDTVRIYPVLVLKGTELERLYKAGRYAPLSLEEATRHSAALYDRFLRAGVTVLRMGLQSEETLRGGAVLAGPYHDAFGELVQGELFYQAAERACLLEGGEGGLRIFVSPRDRSKMAGHRRRNAIRLTEKFGKELRILTDEALSPGQFRVEGRTKGRGQAGNFY